jgi:hypothetical protein
LNLFHLFAAALYQLIRVQRQRLFALEWLGQ